MTAKVENHCQSKRTRHISVDAGVRACINCVWYEQYYHKNRGNVQTWIPTSTGHCLLHETQRGALRQPCRDFEKAKE